MIVGHKKVFQSLGERALRCGGHSQTALRGDWAVCENGERCDESVGACAAGS
jgi:hypothetical protein